MTSIFELPDELFVAEAYFRLLGRPCDPAGFVAYMRTLRAGRSRTALLLDLQDSAEARARRDPHLAPARLSVDPSLWPATLPWSSHGVSTPQRRKLLSLRGPNFVDALCTFVAPRQMDPAQHAQWLAQVDTVEERATLLESIEAKRSWLYRLGLRHRARSIPRPARLASSSVPLGTEATQLSPARSTPPASAADRFQQLGGAAVFTIATRSYLPYVRVLMRSVRSFHPDFQLICLLVDEGNPCENDGDGHGLEPEWIIVTAADLGIPGFADMTWRYDTTELCTALKPMFFGWLLRHTALHSIYYVDPDIRLFAPMAEAQEILSRGAPMILTPHVTAPLDGDAQPNTQTILKSGCFNLGFAAIGRHPESTAFVNWWAERLRTDAVVDFASNRFTDQRWCDMAPCFVAGLVILRHPGYNAAYWNLAQRRLERDGSGTWLADGVNLVFFHFSGVDPARPQQISKYQDRLRWEELGECQALFGEYVAELMAANWQNASRSPRTYDYVDGVHISPAMRRLYRDLHEQPTQLSRQEILSEMLQLCALPAQATSSPSASLSALMRRIHSSRTDLQSTFDLAKAHGARDYCSWFWASGALEHGLGSLLRRAAQIPHPQAASSHGR